MRPATRPITLLALAPLVAWVASAHADGSVWLPTPGSISLSASRVNQDADHFWHIVDGKMRRTRFPPGLEQTSTLLSATYGLADALALDAQIGWSEASNKASPRSHPTQDGRSDLNVGLTWRLVDEIVSDAPSVAVRFGLILQGDYDPRWPTAIGDGADGVEFSGMVGKVFADRLALSAEAGLRYRSEGAPRETLVNLDAHVIATSFLVLSARYHMQRSSGDRDIHGPGFTRFVLPVIAEETDRLSLGGTVSIGPIDLSLNWFDVRDGRNTADFDAFAVTVSGNIGR